MLDVVTTLTQPATDEKPGVGSRVALLTGLVLLSLAPYVVGVLLPYYINDLDALPLADLASGGHDPKDLWPRGATGSVAHVAGLLSLTLTPIGLATTIAGCVRTATSRAGSSTAAARAALVVIALLCLGLLILFFSPMGSALTSWRLD